MAMSKRDELLAMVRTMSDACVDTCHHMVAVFYRDDRAESGAREDSAPRPERTASGGCIVAFPRRRAR
jgi:hypothetical protein